MSTARRGLPSTALGLLVALLAVAAIEPASARADCVFPAPRDLIRQSNAAFIGRFVERQPDGRLVYSVEQRVKGEMGATVVVRDEAYPNFPAIGNLGSTPGVEYALVLRRDVSGFIANGCSSMPPQAMRVAAASGRSSCPRPSVMSIETRSARGSRELRVWLVLHNPEGFPSGARIAWGDGTETDVSLLRSASHQRTLTRSHRYAEPGRYRILVIVRSRPAGVDCFAGGVRQVPTRSSRARSVRVH